jgi:hypothetical protein
VQQKYSRKNKIIYKHGWCAKMHSFVLASTDFTFKRNGKSCPTRMSKFEPAEIIHINVNKMNYQVILHHYVHAVTAVE